ncbi:MAG: energy transducer TonB [Ferruginibacter sp.]
MRYLFAVILLFLSLLSSAQKGKSDSLQSSWGYNYIATFEGGFDSLKRFIGRHTIIPDSLPDLSFTKRGLLKFVVKKDGSTGYFEILEKVGYGYDEAIIAAIKLTKWFPAKENGVAVEEILKLPYAAINF